MSIQLSEANCDCILLCANLLVSSSPRRLVSPTCHQVQNWCKHASIVYIIEPGEWFRWAQWLDSRESYFARRQPPSFALLSVQREEHISLFICLVACARGEAINNTLYVFIFRILFSIRSLAVWLGGVLKTNKEQRRVRRKKNTNELV